MARRRNIGQVLMKGAIGMVAVLMSVDCETSHVTAPVAKDPTQRTLLEAEVLRLSARLSALEEQLHQEHRNSARARQETQEQRERIAAVESQISTPAMEPAAAPLAVQTASTMQAEAELRVAYRALMRAIERLDLSAEEKAALKSSLRPTRSLDQSNPWSVAKH